MGLLWLFLAVAVWLAVVVGFPRLIQRLDATEKRDEANALDVARAVERREKGE